MASPVRLELRLPALTYSVRELQAWPRAQR
jgi:hypothetical protein